VLFLHIPGLSRKLFRCFLLFDEVLLLHLLGLPGDLLGVLHLVPVDGLPHGSLFLEGLLSLLLLEDVLVLLVLSDLHLALLARESLVERFALGDASDVFLEFSALLSVLDSLLLSVGLNVDRVNGLLLLLRKCHLFGRQLKLFFLGLLELLLESVGLFEVSESLSLGFLLLSSFPS